MTINDTTGDQELLLYIPMEVLETKDTATCIHYCIKNSENEVLKR